MMPRKKMLPGYLIFSGNKTVVIFRICGTINKIVSCSTRL